MWKSNTMVLLWDNQRVRLTIWRWNIEKESLGIIKNNNGHTLYGNPKIKRLELWKLDKLMDLNIFLSCQVWSEPVSRFSAK